jgi:hypothetical protein
VSAAAVPATQPFRVGQLDQASPSVRASPGEMNESSAKWITAGQTCTAAPASAITT